jgi:hypothetical protein
VLAQYVAPTRLGTARIIRHGRQWRALINDAEYGRHDTPDAAVSALRDSEPSARVPGLPQWRFIDGHPLANLPNPRAA